MPFLIGAFSGLLGGFFGAGSGLIILPTLTLLLKIDEYVARGTTLFCVLFIVFSSSYFYYKNDFFDWKIGILASVGGILGGIFGAKIMKKIPKFWLSILFYIFLIGISFKMILEK